MNSGTIRNDIKATAHVHGWDNADVAYIFAMIELSGGDLDTVTTSLEEQKRFMTLFEQHAGRLGLTGAVAVRAPLGALNDPNTG